MYAYICVFIYVVIRCYLNLSVQRYCRAPFIIERWILFQCQDGGRGGSVIMHVI